MRERERDREGERQKQRDTDSLRKRDRGRDRETEKDNMILFFWYASGETKFTTRRNANTKLLKGLKERHHRAPGSEELGETRRGETRL